MTKHDQKESLIRMEVMLMDIKKDLEGINKLTERVDGIEKVHNKVKDFITGAAFVVTSFLALFGDKIKMILKL